MHHRSKRIPQTCPPHFSTANTPEYCAEERVRIPSTAFAACAGGVRRGAHRSITSRVMSVTSWPSKTCIDGHTNVHVGILHLAIQIIARPTDSARNLHRGIDREGKRESRAPAKYKFPTARAGSYHCQSGQLSSDELANYTDGRMCMRKGALQPHTSIQENHKQGKLAHTSWSSDAPARTARAFHSASRWLMSHCTNPGTTEKGKNEKGKRGKESGVGYIGVVFESMLRTSNRTALCLSYRENDPNGLKCQ